MVSYSLSAKDYLPDFIGLNIVQIRRVNFVLPLKDYCVCLDVGILMDNPKMVVK